MSQASSYNIAKELILAGKLKSLDELVLILKKTTLALDMKIGPKRLNRLLDNPGKFTIEDIHSLADLIGVPAKPLLDLISSEYVGKTKRKNK